MAEIDARREHNPSLLIRLLHARDRTKIVAKMRGVI
jgi:hypothetical protein